MKGRHDEARATLATFNEMMPQFTLSQKSAADASEHPVFVKQRERLYAALRKLGVPE